MERLSLWFVAFTLAVVFAGPARPDPVDTGSGAQRNFLWHAGDGSVKRLPNSVSFTSVANPDYDPLLDNADAPNPPYANSYCPTNGLRGTSAEPIGCYTNRPEVFEIEDREDFPGLDMIFEVNGADGELGPNPDYWLADPNMSVNDLLALEDELVGLPGATAAELGTLLRAGHPGAGPRARRSGVLHLSSQRRDRHHRC